MSEPKFSQQPAMNVTGGACEPILQRRDRFGEVANRVTRIAGGRYAFLAAILSVVVWAVSGPFFRFSENWQLVINTGTTIITFLMVFLIQNAANRESKAIHLKLDELILSIKPANNALLDIEGLTDEQLDELKKRYHLVATQSHENLQEIMNEVREDVDEIEQDIDEVAEKVDAIERSVKAR